MAEAYATKPAVTTDPDEELKRTWARMAQLFKDLYTQEDFDIPTNAGGIRLRRRRTEQDSIEAIKDDETGEVIFFDRKLRQLKNH
jgi:hypothetical protein